MFKDLLLVCDQVMNNIYLHCSQKSIGVVRVRKASFGLRVITSHVDVLGAGATPRNESLLSFIHLQSILCTSKQRLAQGSPNAITSPVERATAKPNKFNIQNWNTSRESTLPSPSRLAIQ